MQKICDLHIHSKYSGGASKNIDISKIAFASEKKGIDIVGTGDCTHPSWLKELKTNLVEYSNGIYYTPKAPSVHFIMQTEIEAIWKYNSHIKKIHFVILFPNFERLDESLEYISRFGDIRKEGRVKLYKSAENLVYGLKSIDSRIEIIPAHIFTPYYGIFGNHSRFSNLKEALGDSVSLIYAVESGLSADPFMVRSISGLNENTVISNSDSHSTSYHRLGREANQIYLNKLDFQNLIDSIRNNKIIKTYEFKPSAGKYYYDGHRKERHRNNKDYFCSPKLKRESCPFCGKELTRGVLSQVYKLCDQKVPNKLNFQYIVPLLHLISKVFGGTEYTKQNILMYENLIANNGGEYNIWEGKNNFEGIPEVLIEKIQKIRDGDFWFIPGHDANYGKLQFNA